MTIYVRLRRIYVFGKSLLVLGFGNKTYVKFKKEGYGGLLVFGSENKSYVKLRRTDTEIC